MILSYCFYCMRSSTEAWAIHWKGTVDSFSFRKKISSNQRLTVNWLENEKDMYYIYIHSGIQDHPERAYFIHAWSADLQIRRPLLSGIENYTWEQYQAVANLSQRFFCLLSEATNCGPNLTRLSHRPVCQCWSPRQRQHQPLHVLDLLSQNESMKLFFLFSAEDTRLFEQQWNHQHQQCRASNEFSWVQAHLKRGLDWMAGDCRYHLVYIYK